MTATGARAFRAFGSPTFRTVWLTTFVGQLGFWLSFVSIQALMADLTDSDGTWLGVLFFAIFIPALLFAAGAGVLADRFSRVAILTTGYGFLAVVAGGLAVMTLAGEATPARIIPMAFLMGTVFAFNGPSAQALVVNTVGTDDIVSAISLQAAGNNLARVVGPTLTAPILALGDEGAAFATYAGICLLMMVLLRRVVVPPVQAEDVTEPFLARLRNGLRHVAERPPAGAALAILCVSSLSAAGYLALLPIVSDEVFDRGTTGFTTLAAVTGIGSMVGALTTAFRTGTPTLRSAGLLVAGFGASLAVFGTTDSWPVALVAIAVVGAFYFAGMTSLSTLLQLAVEDSHRGRVTSLFQLGWAGLIPFAGLWEGMVAAAAGVSTAVVLAGLVTAVAPLLLLLAPGSRPRARHGPTPAEAGTPGVTPPGSR